MSRKKKQLRSKRGRHTGFYNAFCQRIFKRGEVIRMDSGHVYMQHNGTRVRILGAPK